MRTKTYNRQKENYADFSFFICINTSFVWKNKTILMKIEEKGKMKQTNNLQKPTVDFFKHVYFIFSMEQEWDEMKWFIESIMNIEQWTIKYKRYYTVSYFIWKD